MLEGNWKSIEETINDAVSIAFDGCHKIYILMDEAQHQLMIEYGYDPLLRLDAIGADVALTKLHEWYDESCGLRFVNAVRTVEGNANDGFDALIPQFAEEDEYDDWPEDDEDFDDYECWDCGLNHIGPCEDEE